MNKKTGFIFRWVVMIILLFPGVALCAQVSNAEIMKELKALKDRVNRLEQEVKNKDIEIRKLRGETKKALKVATLAKEKESVDGGIVDKIGERVSIGGLIEVGGAYQDVQYRDGTDDDASDINLTTVEFGVEVAVNDWVNAEMAFLYEDETFGGESGFDVDVGTVTFRNPEESPFHLSAGKMYVPYGALLTHFADSPLVDGPVTLSFGEINEKAVLVGYEQSGISASAYVFNGEVDEYSDDQIGSFGFDVNYTAPEDKPYELFTGVSYINNIAEGGISEGLAGAQDSVSDYVDGFAAYVHVGSQNLFFDAEYMTALDEFNPADMTSGTSPKPSVWNFEVGYNYDWGKNLEVAFKYAGSDDAGDFGFPERRFGIGFNQEIYENVMGSIGFFRDEFHSDDVDNRDKRNIAFGQVAVEF